jgi:pimeloyl-ACP methyl ester carboxylesterase
LLSRQDAEPFLAKALEDTLVLCGHEDTWSPPSRHEEISRALPDNPEVVIIEKCGHMSTMERPNEVTRAMREWLQRLLQKVNP